MTLADQTERRGGRQGAAALLAAVAGDIPKALRGDYVMAVNRFVAGCMMLLASSLLGKSLPFDTWALPIAGWTGCGLLLLMQMRIRPGATALRRSVAIGLDVCGVSIMLAAGGEATSFVYVVYLWVIIGNGFRFGSRYIFAASLTSAAGFAVVIAASPFWREHLGLSLGLMAGILVLPAYSFALIRQVAEAKLQAERADQAKSLFLASVSHELRTPLNAIIGTAELLAETPLSADQAEMVATIANAADGQLSLVRDVLEFSRIDAGHGRSEATVVHIAELLGVVRAIVAVEARRKGLLINTYITARTPLTLIGDERHLREVLLNLCDNAIKFTRSGSVTIAADGSPLPDGLVSLRLEVADTGIGIAASATQHIFDLFTQADSGIMGTFGGTGLGLALCERQVRLMGGTIGVDSVLGAGATFFVRMELARAREAEPPPPPGLEIVTAPAGGGAAARLASRVAELVATAGQDGAPEASGGGPARRRIALVEAGSTTTPGGGAGSAIEVMQIPTAGLPGRWVRERFATSVSPDSSTEDILRALHIASAFSPKGSSPPPADGPKPYTGQKEGNRLAGLRVLVADDNAVNRTIVSRMLEGAGMRPVAAHDGEEALALMTEGAVDLALLDVNMPVMDGIEAAEFYRIALPGGGGMPMIALTADGTPQTRERCLRAGMAACLVKPVRTADLLDALWQAMAVPMAEAAAPEPAGPRYDRLPPPALDLHTLADLHELGGAGFVGMLVEEFKRDGAVVMAQLSAACQDRDVRSFRTRAHSLCSIAANVGARALRDLCLPWKDVSETMLDREAASMITQMRQEWARTRQALDEHVNALPDLTRRP
jgi:two-component system sensor histidine kinase RpfC